MRTIKAVADTELGLILATADYYVQPGPLFNALTNAQEIEYWWGSDDIYHMRDWNADFRVGGDYTVNVVFADGTSRPASGRFLVIDAPFKISHTRKYEWNYPILGGRETTITYRLEPIENGTRLTVRHEGLGGCIQATLDHATGWERVLAWLEIYLIG